MVGVKWEGSFLGKLGPGRKDAMKALLLKAGIALTVSVAGYLFSQFRSHHDAATRRLRLPPPELPEVDLADELNSERRQGGGESVEQLSLVNHDEAPHNFPAEATTSTASVVISPSTTTRSSGDDVGYLLPEFHELVQEEFEFNTADADNAGSPASPRKSGCEEPSSELEITRLRDLVQSLQERERQLEFQLLEYYGLKEQEATVQELKNRLKVNSTETKLYNLKIESLKADNQRLKEQLAVNAGLVSELESAREKIKLLERQLRTDADQAKEELASLGKRVAELQESERAEQKLEEELQQTLIRVKDLEGEARDLKEENTKLAQESVDLAKKLESRERLTSDAQKNSEAIKETLQEANRLRLRNEELTKQIEQIQIDRCSDVEELIYLRWINACLRYELRNYEPLEGKSVARDLNMTLSPESEEKAKQLIWEYAHSGNSEKFVLDHDSECYSSSHSSSIAESEEADDASTVTRDTHHSSKKKFFGKLKKLVLGKGAHSKRLSPSDRIDTFGTFETRGASAPNSSFNDVTRRNSCDSSSSCITLEHTSEHKSLWVDNLFRTSVVDGQKATPLSLDEAQIGKHGRCISDLGDLYGYRRFILGEGSSGSSPCHERTGGESMESQEKEELKRFANVLRNTRQLQLNHKRSKSHGIC